MDKIEYDLLKNVQYRHWWWIGRKSIIQAVIEGHIDLSHKLLIADAGCGYGANIHFLRQYGDVVGLELSTEALDAINSKWGNSVRLFTWKSPQNLNQKFDLILMADVLEHIPDDQEAVNWIYDHLREDGYALLTVPAHQFFWSEMDEVVHHYRRYSRKNFQKLFSQKKFRSIKFSFYNLFLFPVKVAFVLVTRTLRLILPSKKKRSYNDIPPWPVNILFKNILYLESQLIQGFSLPFGVSIIALFQKEKSNNAQI